MPNPYERKAKFVPWYHQAAPECIATTIKGDQCIFTASFQSVDGRISVCLVHKQIMEADPDHRGVRFKPLTAGTVYLR
jgi:hypothetical protein